MTEEQLAKNQFKEGDVVRLKSGGPKMTVEWVSDVTPPLAGCVWFEGEIVRKDDFPQFTLELATLVNTRR